MPSPTIREMVHAGLTALDGHAYLTRQAEQSPRAFLSLIGKVLAAELSAARAGAAAPRATAPGVSKLSPGICELVHAVLIAVGGHAYLARHADKHPRVFLALISKLLAAELRPAGAQRRRRVGSGEPGSDQSNPALPNKQPLPASPPHVREDTPPRPNDPQAEGRAPARPSGTRDLQVAQPQPVPTVVTSTPTRCVASLAALVGPSPSQPLYSESAAPAVGRAAAASSPSRATFGQGAKPASVHLPHGAMSNGDAAMVDALLLVGS